MRYVGDGRKMFKSKSFFFLEIFLYIFFYCFRILAKVSVRPDASYDKIAYTRRLYKYVQQTYDAHVMLARLDYSEGINNEIIFDIIIIIAEGILTINEKYPMIHYVIYSRFFATFSIIILRATGCRKLPTVSRFFRFANVFTVRVTKSLFLFFIHSNGFASVMLLSIHRSTCPFTLD